ncbi:glycoside hydrolase, partial [Pilobolus umbonatus]
IPYQKYTHLNYAFAIMTTPNLLPSFTDDWAVETYLPKMIELAHKNKTKVLLSIGGWTGSKTFSTMAANEEARKNVLCSRLALDWEYPGKQAAGCNEVADNDADNFLLLLKDLRAGLDAKFPNDRKEISMAVHVQPFVKSGQPMTNVKEFVPYFNHINLMTYDINGAWASVTGPNAPFDAEGQIGSPYSFVQSIRDWKEAGVPSDKITAGLAFYGRGIKAKVDMTKENNQYQLSEIGAPKGDSDDAYWTDPFCNKVDGGLSGVWKWSNLRREGLIQDDFVTPGKGWNRYWDELSQTPWLFNPSTKDFISYDDPHSLEVKVNHALCENLAGVMIW